MSDTVCPRCGASGNQQCSTVSGRDHKVRWKTEDAAHRPPAVVVPAKDET